MRPLLPLSHRIGLALALMAVVATSFGLGAFTVSYLAAEGFWARLPIEAASSLQVRSTIAAERSALWALCSLPISFGGLIGLLVSVQYTRSALAQAKRSNETTADALSAARENVRVAERQAAAADRQGELATIQTAVARATSRPWLVIEAGVPQVLDWINNNANMLHWSFSMHNPGPTPAFIKELSYDLYVPRSDEAERLSRNPPAGFSITEYPQYYHLPPRETDLVVTGGSSSDRFDVAGGFPMINFDKAPDRKVVQQHVRNDSGMVWLMIKAFYTDSWGDEHESAELFTTRPAEPGRPRVWSAVRVSHPAFTVRS